MKYLTLEEILILHEYQIEKFGESPGIKDVRLLESAVLRPQTTFDGKDLYADVYEKATALVFSIIKNRPFTDGNKRTGLHAGLVFLELNGVRIELSNKELVKLGIDIANSKINEKDLTLFLTGHQTS